MTDLNTKQPLDYYDEPWTKKFLRGPGPFFLLIGLIAVGAFFGSKKETVEVVKFEMPKEVGCNLRMSYVAYAKLMNELSNEGFEPVMDQQLHLVTLLAKNNKGTLIERELFVCRDSVISTKYSSGKVSFYRSGK